MYTNQSYTRLQGGTASLVVSNGIGDAFHMIFTLRYCRLMLLCVFVCLYLCCLLYAMTVCALMLFCGAVAVGRRHALHM